MAQESNELPEGWAHKTIGQITTLITKGSTPTSYGYKFQSEGINFVKIENVVDGQVTPQSITSFISEDAHEYLKRSQLKENDLLFSIAGSIGTSAIVDSAILPANTNQALALIRGYEKYAIPSFLLYSLRSEVLNETKSKSRGGALQNISLTDIKNTKIPLPPLNEQKRIVAKLDAFFTRIDTAITHLQQTLELSKALFASALDEAFNGGDNVEKVTIKEIAKKIQYGHTAKARDIGNAQFLRITDIQKGLVDWSQVPYVSITEDDLKKYSLNIHDIVFARSGATSGKSFLITSAPDNAIFASYLIRVVPNTDVIIPQFVYLYFQSPEYWGQVSSNVSGAAQPNINGTKLGGFKIPLPAINEQKRIVDHLNSLAERTRKLEASTQEKISDLTTLKASLLDAAFKGKL